MNPVTGTKLFVLEESTFLSHREAAGQGHRLCRAVGWLGLGAKWGRRKVSEDGQAVQELVHSPDTLLSLEKGAFVAHPV